LECALGISAIEIARLITYICDDIKTLRPDFASSFGLVSFDCSLCVAIGPHDELGPTPIPGSMQIENGHSALSLVPSSYEEDREALGSCGIKEGMSWPNGPIAVMQYPSLETAGPLRESLAGAVFNKTKIIC